MGLLADAVKKQQAQKSSNNSGSKSSSSSSSSSKSSSSTSRSSGGSSIFNYNYNDDKKYNAKQAISNMSHSSIFAGENVTAYYDRMACAAEHLTTNDQWKIYMDADGDGTQEDVNLADAIAASFDSELDLYIQDIVSDIMATYGTCSKGYLSESAIRALAMKGIRVDSVGASDSITNRVYSFSLIDLPDNVEELSKDDLFAYVYSDDAKIVEDKNGKKGSYLFADCLIPDGCAQGAEIHLSSILDQMGYDCISKADFIGNEAEYDKMIQSVKDYLDSGEYTSSANVKDIYGNTKDILQSVKDLWGGSGAAPGQFGIGGSGSDGELNANGLTKEQQNQADKIYKQKLKEHKEKYGEDADTLQQKQYKREAEQEAKVKLV